MLILTTYDFARLFGNVYHCNKGRVNVNPKFGLSFAFHRPIQILDRIAIRIK